MIFEFIQTLPEFTRNVLLPTGLHIVVLAAGLALGFGAYALWDYVKFTLARRKWARDIGGK